MNVLVFTTQIHQIGGYERLAVELAEDLNRAGTHTDLLSLYRADLPGVTETVDRVRAAGVPRVHFLGLAPHPAGWRVLVAAWRLRDLVEKHRYDIVETSGFTPTLIAAIGLAGQRARQIAGIHLNYTSQTHGRVRYRVWTALLRRLRPIRFYAISQAVRDHWIEFSRTEPRRTEVVLNAVHPLYFDPPRNPAALKEGLGIDPGSEIILCVGRLLRSKGLDTLIEAAATVLEPSGRHLLIVGREDDSETPDDARMLEEIRSRLAREPWGRRVHFLGHRTDVPAIMAASDVLAHPARNEGFGLVLAEALAVGLPVVATRVGGIPEVLEDTGSILVSPGNPDSLALAIETVLRWSPDERCAAVRCGKARAERYRGPIRAKNMLRLYERALKERNGAVGAQE